MVRDALAGTSPEPLGWSLPADGGVDVNQTWMLSPHFAFSTGFGLKRLIGVDAMEGPRIIPTLRINVRVGF
jgi:hypothetical protein